MKTLIFDFDGTIGDSFELVVEIASEITGIPQPDEAKMAELRQMPLLKAVKAMQIPLYKMPGLVVHGRQKMLERIHEVLPFEGVPDVLRKLHDAGYHLLVISSNSEENVRSFLRTNNLESYFDGVYGNASLLNKASALRRVLKRNRLDVVDCFYIGDEVRDIVAAAKVGMEPVAVTWGYQAAQALERHHPYALARKPIELLRIFPVDKV